MSPMAGLRGWFVLVVFWVLAFGAPGTAQAQKPQAFQLALQRTPEALYLSGRMDIFPEQVVEEALLKSVPLYFVWQADVYRERWYWADRRIASVTRTLRLAYQPLTRRWRVSLSNDAAVNAGGAGLQYALHQNFDSLNEALAGVGRVVRWKIAEAARLESGADHEVEFSFRLDLSLLPRPFQIGVANQPEWTVEIAQRLRVPDTLAPEPAAEPRDTGVPAAEAAGVSVQTLRELNPGLSREQMDPKGPYHVHVPASLDVASENRIAQLTPMIPGYFSVDRRLASLADPAPVAAALPVVMRQETPGRHRVQAKETWYAIARTYNVPPAVLTAANQSSLKTPLEVGRELVIPNTGSTPAATSGARIITVASQNTAANAQDSRIEIIRRVLPGETLESIRRQYQVTLAELRAWNGDLQSLTAGQTLILRLLPDAALPRSL